MSPAALRERAVEGPMEAGASPKYQAKPARGDFFRDQAKQKQDEKDRQKAREDSADKRRIADDAQADARKEAALVLKTQSEAPTMPLDKYESRLKLVASLTNDPVQKQELLDSAKYHPHNAEIKAIDDDLAGKIPEIKVAKLRALIDGTPTNEQVQVMMAQFPQTDEDGLPIDPAHLKGLATKQLALNLARTREAKRKSFVNLDKVDAHLREKLKEAEAELIQQSANAPAKPTAPVTPKGKPSFSDALVRKMLKVNNTPIDETVRSVVESVLPDANYGDKFNRERSDAPGVKQMLNGKIVTPEDMRAYRSKIMLDGKLVTQEQLDKYKPFRGFGTQGSLAGAQGPSGPAGMAQAREQAVAESGIQRLTREIMMSHPEMSAREAEELAYKIKWRDYESGRRLPGYGGGMLPFTSGQIPDSGFAGVLDSANPFKGRSFFPTGR